MSLNLSSSFSGFNLKMDKAFRQTVYSFEDFRLDAEQLMLSRHGEEIALPPKVVETLLVLVEHCGKIVSKDQLLEAVWKDVIVEESNLYGYLHVLRNTLGNQQNGKPFIETHRRRGYRFSGHAQVVSNDSDSVPVQPEQKVGLGYEKHTSTNRKGALLVVLALVLVAFATAGFLYFKSEIPINATPPPVHAEYTKNTEARRLYVQGNELVQRLTPQNYRRALEYFDAAIGLDPNYAEPYVGKATAHRVNMLTADSPPANRMPNAKQDASTAVAMAPDLPGAHIALGMVTFFWDWDWETAEAQLKQGYGLDPNSEDTNIQLAHFYSNMGRHAEAIAHSTRAMAIEPSSLRSGALNGMILFYARRYDECIANLKTWIEFREDFWLSHLNLQRAYIEKGMYSQALQEGELAKKYNAPSLEVIAQRGYIYAKMGDIRMAREALAELKKIEQDLYAGPYLFAVIHQGLGEKNKALLFLEEAHKSRDWRMTFLKVDPRWNNLRTEPRFIELMKKMNFD